MNYIFADSGSTKTNWIITDDKGKKVNEFKTIGLNPYFVTEDRIISAISDEFPSTPDANLIRKVFFYGSGCEAQDNFGHLRDAIKKFFPNAVVYIYSDMLGTARAIFKNKGGIAAIIGTGTNSCLYNGSEITNNAISLGYLLGDEGSGAYIGKMFVKNYLEKRFDKEFTDKIFEETGASHTSILSAIYQKQHPNRFLAGFCPFIKQNIENPQVSQIVRDAFNKFFENYIEIYPNFQTYFLGFCGSVAYHFRDIIEEIASRYNINDIIYINDPLVELIDYHKINEFE